MKVTSVFSLLAERPSDSRVKRLVKKILLWAAKILLGYLLLSIVLVLFFKFVPPFFTPLMLNRSLSAWFAGKENDIHYDWTPYEKISPEAAIAVVASEDQTFPLHYGFDWQSIKQAFKANKVRKRTRGASTITQQVAKNMFLWNGRSYFRKAVEAYYTILLETFWGKERILEVYLNIAEMGERTFGVEAASRRFFGRSAANLSRRQAATLAAVLPNPRRFSAKSPSAYVQRRTSFISRQIRLLGGPAYLKKM